MKSLYWKICLTFLIVQVVSILAGITVFNHVWLRVFWAGQESHGTQWAIADTQGVPALNIAALPAGSHLPRGPAIAMAPRGGFAMQTAYNEPPGSGGGGLGVPYNVPPPGIALGPGALPYNVPVGTSFALKSGGDSSSMILNWFLPPPPPLVQGGSKVGAHMAQTHRAVLELVAASAVRLVQEFKSEKKPMSDLDHQLVQLVAGHPDMIASYVSPDGAIHGSKVDWLPQLNTPPPPPEFPDVFTSLQREGFAVCMVVPGKGGFIYIAQQPSLPDFPTSDQIRWKALQSIGSAMGAILLVAVLFGFLAFWAIARRLREVGACLEAAAQGDLVRRVANPSNDEIGRLGECYNRMAQQLAETLGRLEAVDERRREFLAHVSHELRTPITSVRANLDTLLVPGDANLSTENNTALTHSLEEVDHMACLVEDLLELARMDSPRYRLVREEVILQKLVDHMVSRLRTSLQNRNVQAITHYSPEPVRMNIDARRIGQAVTNLLVNAIRSFNEGGTIEVTVAAVNERAVIEIADSGRGIPESVQQRLFEPFQTGTYGGTGLGLTIVRKLIEAHGGTIALKPRPGGGTVAQVELPLVAPEAQSGKEETASTGAA